MQLAYLSIKSSLTSFVRRISQQTIAAALREPEKSNRPFGANLRCVTPPIVGNANSATARARLEPIMQDKGVGLNVLQSIGIATANRGMPKHLRIHAPCNTEYSTPGLTEHDIMKKCFARTVVGAEACSERYLESPSYTYPAFEYFHGSNTDNSPHQLLVVLIKRSESHQPRQTKRNHRHDTERCAHLFSLYRHIVFP